VAAQKTQSSNASTPAYHATDAAGNKITLQMQRGSGFATLGSASNFVTLSQQNASDLLAAFTQFAASGTLS
jgi:hypothetical protein